MRIDYGELKRRIRLRALLESLGWTSTVGRGDQLRGPCPLPACSSNNGGGSKAAKKCFSVHVGKNVYRCFGCGCGGNVLDFWQAYSGKSLRESAIEMVEQLKTSNRTGENKEPVIPQHPSDHPAKTAGS